jgi:hypothetical protein
LQQNELIRIPHRKRCEHHGMHKAKDRGVRANPQTEREHNDRRETGRMTEHPHGIPQILPDGFDE